MAGEKYAIGWSDPRGTYGDPKVQWEPISSSYNYELNEHLAYVGMATGVSMAVSPLPWVSLLLWTAS
jgi:hypothetical protein